MHQETNNNGLAKVHYKSYISIVYYKAKEAGKNRWLNSLQGTKYVYLTLQTTFFEEEHSIRTGYKDGDTDERKAHVNQAKTPLDLLLGS